MSWLERLIRKDSKPEREETRVLVEVEPVQGQSIWGITELYEGKITGEIPPSSVAVLQCQGKPFIASNPGPEVEEFIASLPPKEPIKPLEIDLQCPESGIVRTIVFLDGRTFVGQDWIKTEEYVKTVVPWVRQRAEVILGQRKKNG